VPSIKKIDKNNSVLPEKVDAILAVLDQHYPEAQCSLDFKKPLELLIATILAAQCTDARVNQVTPSLFKKYPSAKAYADARLEELESDIRSTGFYHNKAKNIQACCRILHERFGGDIPADLNALVELPGIGRKTANVILGSIYHIPGIIVDTHVGRVARRLGLTSHKDPVKIERDLMAIIERERWTLFSHQLVQHGRRICHARKPACPDCPLRPFCDYFQSLE
jgi:endonuclease-3